MAAFTISKVDFANPTGVMQTFSFDYKLWSDPDSGWINISSSSSVNTDGTLVTPLTVTGLDPNTLYYIRAANTCNSPLEYFIKEVTTDDTITTFWNVYPDYTDAGQFGIGSTIIVYGNFFYMDGAPIDIENYTTSYFWIRRQTFPQSVIWGNPNVAYPSSPDWNMYVGNPGGAIVAWLTSILTALIGAAPADYDDVFNEINNTWSIAQPVSSPWDSQYDNLPSFLAAGSYDLGLLNLPTNIAYTIAIKFSKTE